MCGNPDEALFSVHSRWLDCMFEIKVSTGVRCIDGLSHYPGRLVLGSTVEPLVCASGLWSAPQYRRQWKAVASYLVSNQNSISAFVESIGQGPNNVIIWYVRRRGLKVCFRQQYAYFSKSPRRFDAHSANGSSFVRRSLACRSLSRPSEWLVSVNDVRKWLRRDIQN